MTYYIATTAASQSTSCTCTKKHRTVSGAYKCTIGAAGRVKAVRGGKLAILTPAEYDILSDIDAEAGRAAARDWARY